MIQLAHLATGGLAGTRCTNPLAAALAGFVMHGLMDVAPHGEINDRSWEIFSGIAGAGCLLAALGPGSPIVWGALASVLPDTEHALPRRWGGGRDLYPTHRLTWAHSSDTPLGLPAWAQVVLGGAVIGSLLFARRRR